MKDQILSLLMHGGHGLANQTDGRVETDITLMIGGTLVSGTLITEKEYALSNTWLEVIQAADRNSDTSIFAPDDFIHLRDTVILSGGTPISAKSGIFWRCPIAKVEGYFLGKITA